MNWQSAVEKNHGALKSILAMLVALANMTAGSDIARSATLPRHLHRYLLRLLRPAEAATRRLIFVAARGLVVKLQPPRLRKPKPKPEPEIIYVLDRVNGSIVSVPMVMPAPPPEAVPARPAKRSSRLSFPLLDSLKRFGIRHRYVRPAVAPSIRTLDFDPRVPLPIPLQPSQKPALPSADDPLDAGHLHAGSTLSAECWTICRDMRSEWRVGGHAAMPAWRLKGRVGRYLRRAPLEANPDASSVFHPCVPARHPAGEKSPTTTSIRSSTNFMASPCGRASGPIRPDRPARRRKPRFPATCHPARR